MATGPFGGTSADARGSGATGPVRPAADIEAHIVASRGAFTLDMTLTVQPGATLALLGPNGAGKSTATACLAGLVPLDTRPTGAAGTAADPGAAAGAVAGAVAGTDSARAARVSIAGRVLEDPALGLFVPPEQRRIGVVFQDYLLFPHLTVLENVAFGPRAAGVHRAVARDAASAWLDRLGIAELSSRRPAELSGGQAQRVALARALATEPDVLLLDEPLAALDVRVRDEVREELAGHLRDFAGAVIVVTHSFDDVAALASEVIVLEEGRVAQRATVRELVAAPGTAWVEKLVADWAAE